jgi:TolB-like protein/Tfp pilus assembly protein PilF
MSFFNELKRRNVFKVGIAYIIIGWLIMQAGDTLAPALHLPDWVNSALAFFLILGFPLAMFFAWAFEMTPEGLKKEKEVDRGQSITHVTGRKLDFIVIALMAAGLAYLAWDKFVATPQTSPGLTHISSQAEPISTATAPDREEAKDNSIAVLPFVNMSDDGANEYFSDGLSEELLNLLAKIPELKVAARTSSFQFKDRTGDIADIASQLKVANILEGSVRKSGNQVRITAQLIKAVDGYHLWSETYDRTLDNIFQVQDEIAVAVVDALKITLLGEAPVANEVNPDAYALFLQGRYYFDQGNELNSYKAVDAYQKALEIDPEYAEALAGLALAVAWQAGFGYIEYEPGVARALAAAKKAVELDPELALAWVSLSEVQAGYLWEWQTSHESALKAIELDPGNSVALATGAQITRDLGQFDQSLDMFQKALELDPLNLSAILSLARAYAKVRRFEESEQQYLNLLALNPDYRGIHSQYAYTLLLAGRYQDALSEAKKEQEANWSLLLKVFALFSLGRQEESDAGLKTFIETYHEFWAYQIAEVYAWRNEADEAFNWLEAAFQYRDPGLSNLLSDSTLSNIYDDPRWEPFLNKVGLLEAWQAMPAKYKGATR